MESQNPSPQAMQAAVELFNKGRYGEAEVLLRDFTQRFPQHGFGWKILGPVLNSQGRAAEARLCRGPLKLGQRPSRSETAG